MPHANFFGIDLHQISGMLDGPVFRLAHGPRALAQFAVLAEQDGGLGRFVQDAATLESQQNAPDCGNRNVKLLASEQDHQFVLTPAGILLAERQDAFGQFCGPHGLTHLVRPMRALFQGGEIVAVETA